jgi:hypothetical protein
MVVLALLLGGSQMNELLSNQRRTTPVKDTKGGSVEQCEHVRN